MNKSDLNYLLETSVNFTAAWECFITGHVYKNAEPGKVR